MEIINVDGTDMGNEFKGYLEKLIEKENEGRVYVWGHKNSVEVRDIDLFNQIAQATKNNELRKFGGELSFIVGVPIGDELHSEHFTIELDKGLIKSFLDKYNGEYKIN